MSMVKTKQEWRGVSEGGRYGRLEVAGPPFRASGFYQVVCQCDCGNVCCKRIYHLERIATVSCGCYHSEEIASRQTTHGGASKPNRLYWVWSEMLRRCNDPRRRSYPNYGGRGISVCKEWHGFAAFRDWAHASGYAPGLSIDRINNDGIYCQENCQWVSRLQQARNTRRTKFFTIDGVPRPLTEWAEESGVDASLIRSRLSWGWEPKRAVFTPVRHKVAMAQ